MGNGQEFVERPNLFQHFAFLLAREMLYGRGFPNWGWVCADVR